MDPIGLGLSALGGLGGLFSKGPDYSGVLKLFNRAQGRVNPFMNLQLQEFMKARGDIEKGFADAEGNINRGFAGARRGAMTRGKQMAGALTQNKLTSGLYRTSALGQGLRTLGAQTQGELGNIEGSLAMELARMNAQKGAALAGARYNIGNVYPSWLDRKNQITLSKAEMLQKLISGSSDPLTNAIGGAGGMAQIYSLLSGK